MAKPEWGTKRTCPSCGARFYDLQRVPITCPKCDSTFQPEDFMRTKRGAKPAERIAKPAPEKKAPEDEIEVDDTEEDGDDDDGVIEDTDDLSEDNDLPGVAGKGEDET